MGADRGARGEIGVVPVHDTGGASAGAILTGSALGLFSGLLVHAEVVKFLLDGVRPAWPLTVACMGGAWWLSAWLLFFRARRVVTVFRRGCLLGSLQWLVAAAARGPATVLAWTGAEDGSAADRVSIVLGGWLGPLLDGPAPTVLAVCCLLGYLFCSLFAAEPVRSSARCEGPALAADQAEAQK